MKGTLLDSQYAAACHIDGKTAELKQEKKVLQWMLSEKEIKTGKSVSFEKGNDLSFKGGRESLTEKTIWSNQEIPAGACLLLVDVLERNVKQPQLQELLKEYQKPVFLSLSDTCQLQLNRSLSMFQGEGDWNAQKAEILLDTDEHDDKRADKALTVFRRLQEDAAAWDKKARRYAAEQLLSCAIEWRMKTKMSCVLMNLYVVSG